MRATDYCSTKQVAQALGVSVTTIKRWVDDGVLPAHKTAGGHRKILRADVLRLVRDQHFPRLDLGRLNLPAPAGEEDAGRLSRHLLDALRAGDLGPARAVLRGASSGGMPVERLADAVVAPAMGELGREWEAGHIDVMHEHRATLMAAAVLHEIKPLIEANAGKNCPVACGGNPHGDPYLLASLLIQLVLLDAGWQAVNLGPSTPASAFRRALHELRPKLLWLSVGYLPDPERFLEEYRPLFREAERAGVAVAVGGHALHEGVRSALPYSFHGDGLTHLAAFARTLHPRPRPPRRGRPAKRAS